MTELSADIREDKIKILCFGSSTTWGYNPMSGKQFDKDTRWAGVMENNLGSSFEIIEEGYSGRTVLDYIPGDNPANGKQYLDRLAENTEFDILIIFLGINDLFADREMPVKRVAQGIEKMILHVRFVKPHAKIVVIAPPQIHEDFEGAYMYQSEIEKSKRLAQEYKHTAAKNSALFADAGKIVRNSPLDGVHLERDGHIKLGRYMADFIKITIEAFGVHA